ncbi:MAG: hypothetical protein O7A67_10380 [SAR324 cluster bacterium]|nr:hypothetical protein [SAR324 cluster bacterium]MCZ6554192.1 hypothetical protein [SAR324 cluster bacterium]MCZ6748450.1 hypothetical protein [SAR324 cluster bacterium]
MGQHIYFWGTTLLLAVLLYFPVVKLIWVRRVRKLERRLGRTGNEEERQAERRRARMIGGIVAITFAFIFNRALLS